MEKANITLYTVIGDPGRIETAIREHFKEMTKEFTPENGNILLTLADDSTISFNINHRGRTSLISSPPIQPGWQTIFLQQKLRWSN